MIHAVPGGRCAAATHRLLAYSGFIPHALQSVILGAFFTTLLLSFTGNLDIPMIYGGMLCLLTYAFHLSASSDTAAATSTPRSARRFDYRVIVFFLAGLLLLSLFAMPASSDGNRIKLVRILLGAQTGSAWDTSRVDELSLMYFAPAPYYLIFTPIEALHLPKNAYAIFNTALILGAMLNLFLLLREKSVPALLLAILFIAAPQFLFAGLSEHEDALTFFLATRAAVWLICHPPKTRAVIFFVFLSVLSVAIKYSTAVFLPFMLAALLAFCSDRAHVLRWLQPRTILYGLSVAIVSAAVIFLPDAMTSASRGLTLPEQLSRMSSYHVGSTGHCGLPHLFLRLFEFFFEAIRLWINFFKLNLSPLMPAFQFMPPGCAQEDTSLAFYATPAAVARDYTQYGFLPLLALATLFSRHRNERRLAAFSWLMFLLSVATYSFSFLFWSGTGRYFMVGFVCLLPAFILSMRMLLSTGSRRRYRFWVLLALAPAFMIFVRSADIIPRMFTQGDRYAYFAEGITPALKSINGEANIYFNDLMSFYTLLRIIPSHHVTLKKELVPDAVNVIALPRTYSPEANWHDDFWLLPFPSAQGDFGFMGPVRKAFGNRVPVTFYMGTPGKPAGQNAVRLVRYTPQSSITAWAKALGLDYHLQKMTDAGHYFLQAGSSDSGLCLRQGDKSLAWQTGSLSDCKEMK